MTSHSIESHSPGRYTLHQTIADYGRSHLQDLGAFQRLIDYYIGYLQAHQADEAAIEQESYNIRVALQRAITRMPNPMRILRVPASNLHIQSSQQSLDPALSSPQPTVYEEYDPLGMAMAAIYLGSQAWTKGLCGQAERYLFQGLELAQRLDNKQLMAFCYGVLAGTARESGDHPRAEQHVQDGFLLCHQMGHEEGVALLHAVLGHIAQEQGDYARAETEGLEGVRIARQINNPVAGCTALVYLGLTKFLQGEDQQACSYYLEGLELARSIAYLERAAVALTYLSLQAYALAEYQQAECYALEGLTLARQGDYRGYIGQILGILGLLSLAQGDPQRAETYLREGLNLARRITYPLLTSRLLINWGMLYLAQEQLNAAEQALREAYDVAPKTVPEVRAISQYYLAHVAAARENWQEAQELATASLVVLEMIGHRDANTVKKALQGWS